MLLHHNLDEQLRSIIDLLTDLVRVRPIVGA